MRDFLWRAFYEHSFLATFASIVMVLTAAAMIVRGVAAIRSRAARHAVVPVGKQSPVDDIIQTWGETARSVISMSREEALAYAVVTCRRFVPAYEEFHSRTGHGDPLLLAAIRNLLLDCLRDTAVVPGQYVEVSRAFNGLHRDEEELSDEVDAIDAFVVHGAALELGSGGSTGEVAWLVDACMNRAYQAATEHLDEGAFSDFNEREAAVRRSAPYRAEVQWQEAIVAALRKARTREELEWIARSYPA